MSGLVRWPAACVWPPCAVTVVIEDSQFRILHDGIQLAAHPRTVIKQVTRRGASGHINYKVW